MPRTGRRDRRLTGNVSERYDSADRPERASRLHRRESRREQGEGDGDMQTLPPRAWDSDRVGVTLNPGQAREVARALRIQLACEFERPFDAPLPSREDAGRLRMLLDLCVDQLEILD